MSLNFSLFELLLTIAAYGPLAYFYLAMAFECWKEGLSEPPSKYMHPVGAAMGQTFCALWILIAPFFLALLAILFGKAGMSLFNIGCGCLYWGLTLWDEKRKLFLALSLFIAGGLALPAALFFAMPK